MVDIIKILNSIPFGYSNEIGAVIEAKMNNLKIQKNRKKKSRHYCRDFPLLIILLFNVIEHLCGYPTTFSCPRNRHQLR